MPLGRVGNGADVADVVVFLASDAARYVNGVNLPVDGGLSVAMIGVLPMPSPADAGAITAPLQMIHEKAEGSAAGSAARTPAAKPKKT